MLWLVLPAIAYALRDVWRIKTAVESVPEDRREAAIAEAGGRKELARVVIAKEQAERDAAAQEKAFKALSVVEGKDPAAGVTADPVGTTPLIGSGGSANYLPVMAASQTEVTRAETPDIFLPALVVAGLWFWSKQRR